MRIRATSGIGLADDGVPTVRQTKRFVRSDLPGDRSSASWCPDPLDPALLRSTNVGKGVQTKAANSRRCGGLWSHGKRDLASRRPLMTQAQPRVHLASRSGGLLRESGAPPWAVTADR